MTVIVVNVLFGAMLMTAFALFPVVWFMPNTQQVLGQETTTLVPIPGPAAPTTLAHQQTPTLLPKLRWSPNLG